MRFNIKDWQDKYLIKEDRAKMTRIFSAALDPFFKFLKHLDRELPQQAKSNPNMKKDLVKLQKLQKEMLDKMDEWGEFLTEMDGKY